MLNSLASIINQLRATHGAKLIRFGAVSAFNVVLGQTLLFLGQVALELPPVGANIAAVSVGTIPAYFLSRYWVWEKRGTNSFMSEVVPFWTLAFLGFGLSTAAIWFVDSRWDAAPIVVNMTNLAAFGIIWMAKFVILDRVLFKAEDAPALS